LPDVVLESDWQATGTSEKKRSMRKGVVLKAACRFDEIKLLIMNTE
jgi:hypothetical protein